MWWLWALACIGHIVYATYAVVLVKWLLIVIAFGDHGSGGGSPACEAHTPCGHRSSPGWVSDPGLALACWGLNPFLTHRLFLENPLVTIGRVAFVLPLVAVRRVS